MDTDGHPHGARGDTWDGDGITRFGRNRVGYGGRSVAGVAEVGGGGYTLGVGLTNITDAPVKVKLDAANPPLTAACAVTFGSAGTATVPAASHEAVVLKFGPGCQPQDVKSVVLGVASTGHQVVPLHPMTPTKAKPDWGQIWAFVVALGGAAAFVVLLALGMWVSPGTPLVGLPPKWKLSDSLVTNTTVVGGTLAGVVGSSGVVKAFLGHNADPSIALATVGIAVAAALVALAAVLVQMAKRKGQVTVGGLMTAAAVTLGGAYGELYVLWQNGEELALGGWEGRLKYIVFGLALLLLLYAFTSLLATIRQGLAPPPAPTLSSDAIAATVIAAKLIDGTSAIALQDDFQAALRTQLERRLPAEPPTAPAARPVGPMAEVPHKPAGAPEEPRPKRRGLISTKPTPGLGQKSALL